VVWESDFQQRASYLRFHMTRFRPASWTITWRGRYLFTEPGVAALTR
jgi:hypothetical protein